jgi:hypothetical protein
MEPQSVIVDHGPDGARWQRLRGRIEEMKTGVHRLIVAGEGRVPDWPFDKSRIVKGALLEAESALKRAEQASEGAVDIARMAERIEGE